MLNNPVTVFADRRTTAPRRPAGAGTLPQLLAATVARHDDRLAVDAGDAALNVSEFDVVEVGDGCSLNRGSCVETHPFHDRPMRTGPSALGPGSTLGPSSAELPDTALGAATSVGGRSFVLRGEALPADTRRHGTPVVMA